MAPSPKQHPQRPEAADNAHAADPARWARNFPQPADPARWARNFAARRQLGFLPPEAAQFSAQEAQRRFGAGGAQGRAGAAPRREGSRLKGAGGPLGAGVPPAPRPRHRRAAAARGGAGPRGAAMCTLPPWWRV